MKSLERATRRNPRASHTHIAAKVPARLSVELSERVGRQGDTAKHATTLIAGTDGDMEERNPGRRIVVERDRDANLELDVGGRVGNYDVPLMRLLWVERLELPHWLEMRGKTAAVDV